MRVEPETFLTFFRRPADISQKEFPEYQRFESADTLVANIRRTSRASRCRDRVAACLIVPDETRCALHAIANHAQPNLPPDIRLKSRREFLLPIIYKFENILIFISRLNELYFIHPVDSQF
ncbi:hypothetical protein [Burkholderia ubonensis]|uniref:hypothetical protein n=1 Tax=Burkholderia ubonensis TaxID=101571 RepID=UPI000AD4BBA0|nr:hypothetical protein [Burkholderia ubonensis]